MRRRKFYNYELITFSDHNELAEWIQTEGLSEINKNILIGEKDVIVSGLTVEQAAVPDDTVLINAGYGVAKNGDVLINDAQIEESFLAITTDRYCNIECRLANIDSDPQSRYFIDASGNTSIATVNKTTLIGIETRIVEGTDSAAPAVASGWTKIAEVYWDGVEVVTSDIKNVDAEFDTEVNTGWTTDASVTILQKTMHGHRHASILDHADGSVTEEKLSGAVVTKLNSGQVVKDIHGISGKIIIYGGIVAQNGANAVDITELLGYAPLGATAYTRIFLTAQSAFDLSALTIPPTWGSVNYLKVKSPNEITCDVTAPSVDEAVLAELTSADSGVTIVISYASRTITPPVPFESSMLIESKNLHATYTYNGSGELTEIVKRHIDSAGSVHSTEKAHYIRLAVTGMTWNPATLRLTKASAFSTYTHVTGDCMRISGGTGVVQGTYVIVSKVDNSTIELDQSISAGSPTDVDCTGDGDLGALEKIIDGKTYREVIVYDSNDSIASILRTYN